jgi:hypothetical protein
LRDRRILGAAALLVLVALGAGLWLGLGGFGRSHRRAAGPPPLSSPAPAAPTGPTGPVSLDGWKLSIPVQNEDGDATTVQPAEVRAPWMTRTGDGGLTFWAPTRGSTTKHSEHPRTELDSLTNFSAGEGRHTLTASLTLQQEPVDGRGIILGQIHGADDISSVPYVMLRYQQGRVRVVVKQVQDGDDLINYPLLDNVEVGDTFDYSITDNGDGNMIFTATMDGVSHQSVAPVPSAFKGATVRFQAGDYQQAFTAGEADDGGRVTFHELSQQP